MAESSRRFCIYCNRQDINDATFHYVELIRLGLAGAGHKDLGVTRETAILRQADTVVTISCQMAVHAVVRHPRADIVHWFQGIEAVERRHIHGGAKGWAQYVLWSAVERWLLRNARVKLFVSDEMRQFLADRERPGQRSLVVPCYNAAPTANATVAPATRYSRLHLVYAGSLFKWQCVEHVLLTFREVRLRRPDAELSVFTREVDHAHVLCAKFGLHEGIRVRSLSPEELVRALHECSFGFILREQMAINEVSTPTKLSTYLAAGVIPVLTAATPALIRLMGTSPYKVVANSPDEHARIAQGLIDLAEAAPSPAAVEASYAKIFADSFSDSYYVARIAEAVRTL